MKMEKCLIFGAGGHARVIADVIRRRGKMSVEAFVAPSADARLDEPGCARLVTEDEAAAMGVSLGILGVGDNHLRRIIRDRVVGLMPSLRFVSVVDPSAIIGHGVQIGAGAFVGPGAILNTGTRVGEHVIVNSAAVIEHDCKLGDFASVGPRAVLGGGAETGAGAHIGIGAVVRELIKIGENTIIGGGANVVGNLQGNIVALGNPAKPIRTFTPGDKYLGYRGR